MRYDWARYQRQLGLVYQERIARLRVALVGDDPALSYALLNLALLGAGASENGALLVVSDRSLGLVTEADIPGQCLLMAEDVGDPLDEAIPFRVGALNPDVRCQVISPAALSGAAGSPVALAPDVTLWLDHMHASAGAGQRVIYGRTGRVGLTFGAQPTPYLRPAQPGDSLLTAALAATLGALLAQEVLRVCGLLRPYPIERFWLTANLRLAPGVTIARPPYLNIAGAKIPSQPSESTEDKANATEWGALYRAVLPFESDLTRWLWGATTVDAPTDPALVAPIQRFSYSPFTRWRPPQTPEEAREAPDGLHAPTLSPTLTGKRLVIGGAGGLGSWALMALAASPLYDSEALVFESDSQVEQHNLNRQILYRAEDVGAPKADAIQQRVYGVNPALRIETDASHLTWDDRARLGPLLARADAALTTFDNFAARYVLGLAATQAHVPLINGGSSVFTGDVELIRPDYEGCIECFWEAEDGAEVAEARRQQVDGQSCTREDDSVGQIGTAIVTTNAVIGGMQALLTLAYLATPHAAPQDMEHKAQFWGQQNLLARCRLPMQINTVRCPIHKAQSNHTEHLARYMRADVDADVADGMVEEATVMAPSAPLTSADPLI